MEIFVDSVITKNNKTILLCGICKKDAAIKVVTNYKKEFLKTAFTDTKDEYFLDYMLMKYVVSFSLSEVIATGASICQKGVIERTGGIIGNPCCSESEPEEIEKVSENLYCVGFSGRIGFVIEGSHETAEALKIEISKLLDDENQQIVDKAKMLIEAQAKFYILVSDGSGAGGYPFVCGRMNSQYKEKTFNDKRQIYNKS